jgi:replicative DNA helicase
MKMQSAPKEAVRSEFYDEDAEMSVLGAMMENNAMIAPCLSILTEDTAFFRGAHQVVCMAIRTLFNEGKPSDPVSVGEWLQSKGELNRVGGGRFLYELVERVPTPENAEYYAEIVQGKYILRQVVTTAQEIGTIAKGGEYELDEVLALAQEKILGIGKHEEQVSIDDQVNEAFDLWSKRGEGELTGLDTGYQKLNAVTGGFGKKKMIVVGGKASVGKSAFVHNILFHVAIEQGLPAVLFCYEDTAADVINRLVSIGTEVSQRDSKVDTMSLTVKEMFKKIQLSSLIIIDNPPPDVAQCSVLLRRLKTDNPALALAIVDHIQLMSADGVSTGEQEVSVISRTLKSAAKTADVPLIAVSQLSRASERYDGQVPTLKDLRGSGMIGADADKVIFIHREDYEQIEKNTFEFPTSDAIIFIAKQRSGPLGAVRFKFHRAISKYVEER